MGCRCDRSGCVKRYCVCFAAQTHCGGNCVCKKCENADHVPPAQPHKRQKPRIYKSKKSTKFRHKKRYTPMSLVDALPSPPESMWSAVCTRVALPLPEIIPSASLPLTISSLGPTSASPLSPPIPSSEQMTHVDYKFQFTQRTVSTIPLSPLAPISPLQMSPRYRGFHTLCQTPPSFETDYSCFARTTTPAPTFNVSQPATPLPITTPDVLWHMCTPSSAFLEYVVNGVI